jgi:hypothetical protein
MSGPICQRTDCTLRNKKTGACSHGGPGYVRADGTCGSFDKILTPSERAVEAHRTMWENKGSPTTVHLALYCVDSNPVEMGRDAFACHSKPKHFGDRTVLPDLTGDIDDITCEKCKKSKLYALHVKLGPDGEFPDDVSAFEFRVRKPKATESDEQGTYTVPRVREMPVKDEPDSA